MQYGLDIPINGDFANSRTLAQLAAEAEEAGWDGFFVQEGVFSSREEQIPLVDPWIALAAIAMYTQRLKIGVMITPLSRRRPWQVARQGLALDQLSNGRFIFGAGLGCADLDFLPFGEEYDPKVRAEMLDEGLEIVNGLWSGERYSLQGKHYQIDDVQFLPRPVQQPRIPIWVAAGWPRRKPFRRVARWDGVYLMTYHQTEMRHLTPDEVREIIVYINSLRQSSTPLEVAVNGLTRTSGPSLESANIVRPYAEAGATWWIEYLGDLETFANYRQRILQGPPKV